MTDPTTLGPAGAETVEQLRIELNRSRQALREMSKVGAALLGERDPMTLFDLILTQARALTGSDAGSLYLVEKDDAGHRLLHFIASQIDTLPDLPSLANARSWPCTANDSTARVGESTRPRSV